MTAILIGSFDCAFAGAVSASASNAVPVENKASFDAGTPRLSDLLIFTTSLESLLLPR
jgi:hypothetical protein